MKPLWKKIIDVVTNRVFLLGTLFTLLFSILITRMFYLQIVKGEEYVSNDNYSQREIETEGIRGNIYDINGRPLTVNEVVFSVMIMPEDTTGLTDEELNANLFSLINIVEKNNELLEDKLPLVWRNEEVVYKYEIDAWKTKYFKREVMGLKTLTDEELERSAEDMFIYLKEKFEISDDYDEEMALKIINIRYQLFLNRFKTYQSIAIVKSVSTDTMVYLKEHQSEFPGIYITNNVIRTYPYGDSVAHILGYTDDMPENMYEELKEFGYDKNSIVGISGMEKEMELYLKGKSGKKVYDINSSGKIVNETIMEQPGQGDNVYLSIDAELQKKIYKRVEEQLADVLLEKMVINPTKPGEIGPNEVLFALFNNNFIDLDEMSVSEGYYSKILNASFENMKVQMEQRFRSLMLSDSLIKDYGELYQEFYIELAQSMKINKHFKYDYDDNKYLYQTHESYELYKNYEISTPEFIELCLVNNFIQGTVYKNLPEDPKEATKQVIEDEVDRFVNSKTFDLQVIKYMIDNNLLNGNSIIMVLYEQGLITGTDAEMQRVANGGIHPITVIENKINYTLYADGVPEIKPYQLGLDPSTGSVVITDVNTGAVLAMVSYPGYDNNKIGESDYFYEVNSNKTSPLLNRPLQEPTEPGSTFKMLTSMAALEEGVVTVNEKINALGTYDKHNPVKPPKCWSVSYGYVHGPTDLKRALEVSCNYYFSEMAFRLGKMENGSFVHSNALRVLDKYIHYFGLDTTSGIELGEQQPLNASVDAMRAAFGNNRDLYTPAQLARYVASLANGGTTYNLFMIDKVVNQNKELVEEGEASVYYENNFNPDYIKAVQEGMYDVTAGANGTARAIFTDLDMEVAGKTGTAQNSHGTGNEHAVFTGYAPYEKPQIAVSVVLPYAGSSANAAVMYKEVIQVYFDMGDVSKEDSKDNQFIY